MDYNDAESDYHRIMLLRNLMTEDWSVSESYTLFPNIQKFTCAMAYSLAASAFKKDKGSFFLSVCGLVVHEWDHLMWDPFLWPSSGLESADNRYVDMMPKHPYPAFSISFTNGVTWPERQICAATGEDYSKYVWRAMRTHLKAHLNRPIVLNGIFISNWQYNPASSTSKGARGVVNTSFFDLGQYKVDPTGNRVLVFDDVDDPSSIMHVARVSSAPRNLPAIAKVEVDTNVFLYVIIYAPSSMSDLIALICNRTKRQVAAYVLMPAKPLTR